DTGAGDQVVHRQRAGDVAGTRCPRRAAAERRDADDATDTVLLERLGGGARAMTRRSSPLSSRLPRTWWPMRPLGVVITIIALLRVCISGDMQLTVST